MCVALLHVTILHHQQILIKFHRTFQKESNRLGEEEKTTHIKQIKKEFPWKHCIRLMWKNVFIMKSNI